MKPPPKIVNENGGYLKWRTNNFYFAKAGGNGQLSSSPAAAGGIWQGVGSPPPVPKDAVVRSFLSPLVETTEHKLSKARVAIAIRAFISSSLAWNYHSSRRL